MIQGRPVFDEFQIGGVELSRLGFEQAHVDRDSGAPQLGNALAGHLGKRILLGHDDARHAGRDQGLGAGPRLALMAAGFERDKGRGAAGRAPALFRASISACGPPNR